MRVMREISLGDARNVIVKEMTVGEIRQWLEVKQGASDLVDVTLFVEIAVSDLTVFSDLDPAAIDALTPSEITKVIEVAKEINADFFEMRSRIAKIGEQIMSQKADQKP